MNLPAKVQWPVKPLGDLAEFRNGVNEALEALNIAARKLEKTIAANVAEILGR